MFLSPYSHINDMYEWQYPRVLKCQKMNFLKASHHYPKVYPYSTLGPEECYPKNSLNVCSLKFIDLCYKHPWTMGEKMPCGLSKGHVLKAHPQD